MRHVSVLLAVVFAVSSIPGCSGKSNPAPPAEQPKTEGDLALTTISADAYKSLRIASQPAKIGPVQEQLPLTGWIMAKQG